MEELKINDTINYEGKNYKILFFHKGFGNSEITARLVDGNGIKRDVLKRILEDGRSVAPVLNINTKWNTKMIEPDVETLPTEIDVSPETIVDEPPFAEDNEKLQIPLPKQRKNKKHT